MNFTAALTGLLSAACVLAALVVPRFFLPTPVEPGILDLREVELAFEEPPPPPPPPPAGSGDEEPGPPPPPIALTGLSDLPDPSMVALPVVDIPLPPDLPVDAFQFAARSGLPAMGSLGATGNGTGGLGGPGTGLGKGIGPGRPAPPSAPGKASYRVTELDGSPRLLHHPGVTFPSRLAAAGVRAGTVVLEVELSEAGRVSVRRVVSSTHPELVAPARYLAQGSRYTPPKMNGVAVKAVMRWPITITQ